MDYGDWNSDTRINRMFEGTMRSEQTLSSENGRYKLKISLVQSERKVKYVMNVMGKDASDWKNFNCSLELYENDKCIKTFHSEKDDFPNYINRDYWREPDQQMANFLENKVPGSSEIISFLQVTGNGEVNIMLGARKKWVGGITNQYWICLFHSFIPSYEKKDIKPYIEITNEGKVNINDLATDTLFKELM